MLLPNSPDTLPPGAAGHQVPEKTGKGGGSSSSGSALEPLQLEQVVFGSAGATAVQSPSNITISSTLSSIGEIGEGGQAG